MGHSNASAIILLMCLQEQHFALEVGRYLSVRIGQILVRHIHRTIPCACLNLVDDGAVVGGRLGVNDGSKFNVSRAIAVGGRAGRAVLRITLAAAVLVVARIHRVAESRRRADTMVVRVAPLRRRALHAPTTRVPQSVCVQKYDTVANRLP